MVLWVELVRLLTAVVQLIKTGLDLIRDLRNKKEEPQEEQRNVEGTDRQ